MSRGRDRTVFQRPNGDWVNQRHDADKASSIHPTQAKAYQAAREMAKNQGGAEVTVQGRKGEFVTKNTIAPAKDPYPPPG